MPSPLAHIVTGLAIAHWYKQRQPFEEVATHHRWQPIVTAIYAILPDLDVLFGLAFSDMGRFHSNVSHSMLAGLVTSLAGAFIANRSQKTLPHWFLLGGVSYGSHLLMDFLSTRRGIPLLWPVSKRRFRSPLKLFYGFRWDEPLISKHHLWTLLTETMFFIVAFLALRRIGNKRDH